MLVSFLSFIFFLFNIFLIIIIVMQKNHGGFWSGPAGSDSTLLFGGNQGADVLQKLSWFFGAILIIGCFALSMYYASSSQISKFDMVISTTEKDKSETEKISDTKETQQKLDNLSSESENKKS